MGSDARPAKPFFRKIQKLSFNNTFQVISFKLQFECCYQVKIKSQNNTVGVGLIIHLIKII